MSGLWRTVKTLLLPPRCMGCGARLRPAMGQAKTPQFCLSCAQEWERAMLCQCPVCYRAYCDCTCQPYVMKRAGAYAFVKLAPYGDDAELHIIKQFVGGLKRHPLSDAFAFGADCLKEGVEKALLQMRENESFSHTVVAHLPRAKRKIRKHGFDQAKHLAKALARVLGVPYCNALKRVRDGADQKGLNTRDRMRNVKGAFSPKASVEDCCVILVDDIVTTGAGMAEAVRVLRRNGAKQVLAVSLAATRKVT